MAELRRSLPLSLVVLYGLGVMIGAGIYVLLGATTGKAGIHAPVSFLLASIVMAFSAASYAELSAHFPESAGEAAYVRAGFGSTLLATATGFLVILSGIISSSAISVGSTGYIHEFVDIPVSWLVVGIVLSLGGVAAWGIMQSVLFASLFSILEVGALLYVVATGVIGDPSLVARVPELFPAFGDTAAWAGVAGAGLLAFFAFIGFEDIVNLAEEVEDPERALPWAIFLTLGIGTLIYFMVTAVTALSVPMDELIASKAPVSFVFEHISGLSPWAITAIAIAATLNGVIIQIIMASRVLYGLAKQGSVPAFLGAVHQRTRTPLAATAAVTGIILILALTAPLESLAEWTSRIVLVVFALVNTALLILKVRGAPTKDGCFTTWFAVPVLGLITSVALLAEDRLITFIVYILE